MHLIQRLQSPCRRNDTWQDMTEVSNNYNMLVHGKEVMRLYPIELMKEKGSGGTATSTAPSSICVTFFIEGLRDGSS